MKKIFWIGSTLIAAAFAVVLYQRPHLFRTYEFGEAIDSLNHVQVYYNGKTGNINGRNVAPDGYNIGLKYQCVEFVKRYYYEHYHHRMPNTYGNAVDFFANELQDGGWNADRALTQYTNPSRVCPEQGDLLVVGASTFNEYGHVAIVSEVREDEVQIIQQNGGVGVPTRRWYGLKSEGGRYRIDHDRVLGWLRKPD